MKQGGPLKRRKPLKAHVGLSQRRSRLRSVSSGSAPASKQEREENARAAQRWKLTVCHRKAVCAVCGRGSIKGDPLQAHHVTTKETIKRYVRSLRLSDGEARTLLRRLLWDTRNGMPVHRSEHDLHTRARKRIPLRCLTAKNHQFAAEVEASHLIGRYYPSEGA